MTVRQQSYAVVLLGASGKLGRMVQAVWRSGSLTLAPVVRSGPVQPGEIRWAPGDSFPGLSRVAAVLALWGVTPGPGRNLKANTDLARSAMDLGEALGAGAVIHCSSAAVYKPAQTAISESVQPDPQSAYGSEKWKMEQAILAEARKDGPRQIILRIANVAGADSLFGNLRVNRKITLDRFGDGQGPVRSYVSPFDLVKAIEALVQNQSASGVFNVAAPVPTAMEDIAKACGAGVSWRPAPETAFQLMWIDTARLEKFVSLSRGGADAALLADGARRTGIWP